MSGHDYTPRYAQAAISSASKRPSKHSNSTKLQQRHVQLPSIRSHGAPSPRPIRPADSGKTCGIAKLPTEIRLSIYELILPQDPISLSSRADQKYFRVEVARHTKKSRLTPPPPLLHVSSLIRLESAELYYSKSAFVASFTSLEPKSGGCWLDKIPPHHLAFMNRNLNITLNIPYVSKFWNFSPHEPCNRDGDGDLPFGFCNNCYGRSESPLDETEYYGLSSTHFDRVKYLTQLWLLCNKQLGTKNIPWNVSVDNFPDWTTFLDKEILINGWLYSGMAIVPLYWMDEGWIEEGEEKELKRPALFMLDGLDRCFEDLKRSGYIRSFGREDAAAIEGWNTQVEDLRKFFEQW